MIKKMEWNWEPIEDKQNIQTYRAKVIGGWILLTVIQDTKLKILSNSTVFIPDRDSEWTIVKPKVEVEASQEKISEGY